MNKALTKILISLLLLPSLGLASEEDISGIWKHCGKPAWLEIRFQENRGQARVFRHATNENAQGLLVLDAIQSTDKGPAPWRAKIYSAASQAFVHVFLYMPTTDRLRVELAEAGIEEVLCLQRDHSAGHKSIEDLRWQQRVLLLERYGDSEVLIAQLEKETASIDERDIAWIVFDQDRVNSNYPALLNRDLLAQLRREFGSGQNRTMLIGKDGGIKLQQ